MLKVTPLAYLMFYCWSHRYGDDRGFFLESFNAREFEAATELGHQFVQDNHSSSNKGVLRGLHYQVEHAQGLVRVIRGTIFDVAVDIKVLKHSAIGLA